MMFFVVCIIVGVIIFMIATSQAPSDFSALVSLSIASASRASRKQALLAF